MATENQSLRPARTLRLVKYNTLETDHTIFIDRGMFRDLLSRGLRRSTIQLKDTDCEALALIATERHIGNIHIVLAECHPAETKNKRGS